MVKSSFVLLGLFLITQCTAKDTFESPAKKNSKQIKSRRDTAPFDTMDYGNIDEIIIGPSFAGGSDDVYRSPFSRTYSRGNSQSNVNTYPVDPYRHISRSLANHAPSLFAYKMMQHMADKFNENVDQPANVNADGFTSDTFRPNQTLKSLSNGLMDLRDGLYSMLETAKNIPIDKVMKNSGMVMKQTAVYYKGDDGITTKKIIRKCCIGNDCYTPKKNEKCDVAKIPRSEDDEQQRRSKGVRESKNSISNSAPELDSQKSFRSPSATGNLNKARRRTTVRSPTLPSISNDRNVESSSTLEPNDPMLNKLSSPNVSSYKENNDLSGSRNARNNSKNFESISKSESSNDIENIKRTVLQRTNEYRQKHNLSDLVLNNKLNEESQTWADNLLSTFNFMDIPHRVYGINLYSTIGGNNIGKEAVDTWYNEMALFNPEDTEEELEANINIHHMTQLLWKNSQQVGIGVSKRNGKYVVVCSYDPPGNIFSQYHTNLVDITKSDIVAAKLALKKKKN